MLKRLSNVIYWFFIVISSICIFAFGTGLISGNDDVAIFLFFGVLLYILGWVIRYILTGETDYIFKKKIKKIVSKDQ